MRPIPTLHHGGSRRPHRAAFADAPPRIGAAYLPGTAVAGWLPAPLALSVVAPLSLLPRPWRALSGRIRGRARGPSPPGWAYRPHPCGMRRWPWGRSSLAAARWAAPPVLFAQPPLRRGRARRPLRPGSAAPRLLAPTPALGGRPSAPGRAPCSVALPSAPGGPASLGRPPVWARVGPCAAWRRGPSVPPLAGRLSPSPGGSRCPPAALFPGSAPSPGAAARPAGRALVGVAAPRREGDACALPLLSGCSDRPRFSPGLPPAPAAPAGGSRGAQGPNGWPAGPHRLRRRPPRGPRPTSYRAPVRMTSHFTRRSRPRQAIPDASVRTGIRNRP